jgi:hypothetical protein
MIEAREMAWTIKPGEVVRRTDLHEQYGGGRQGGISPSRSTPNVLVFSDAASGEQHGYYDHWEGEVLHYCGEGQKGDQRMRAGNRAILDHRKAGKALRVFEGARREVAYVGEFEIDPDEPWYYTMAPASGGGPNRQVIIFRLRPVSDFVVEGGIQSAGGTPPTLKTPYRRADEEVEHQAPVPAPRNSEATERASRAHARLQNMVSDWAAGHGFEPLSPGLGDPPFDVAWRTADGRLVMVEVKSLTDQTEAERLRLGLGQVLDYEDRLRPVADVRPVLFIERELGHPRWTALCARHGIVLASPASIDRLRVE